VIAGMYPTDVFPFQWDRRIPRGKVCLTRYVCLRQSRRVDVLARRSCAMMITSSYGAAAEAICRWRLGCGVLTLARRFG
jgi:hypothetical protein